MQEVADYYWLHDQDVWDMRDDFPVIASPWPEFWMEWRAPRVVRIRGEQSTPDFFQSIPRFGVLGRMEQVDDRARAALPPDSPDVRWILQLAYFGLAPVAEVSLPLDHEGRFAKVPVEGGVLQPTRVVAPGLKGMERALLLDVLSSWLNPAFLALSFAHCRNVVVREAPIEGQRARIRRGDPPISRYYVLEIGGMREIVEQAKAQTGGNLRTALHLVRGHFKSFTPERPLFGRYTGTYWWGLHARGDARAGEVRKDYAVAPPPDEAPQQQGDA